MNKKYICTNCGCEFAIIKEGKWFRGESPGIKSCPCCGDWWDVNSK